MAFSTFNVSDVLLKLAEQEGIYLSVEGVDDVCYGCVIAADKTFNSFLTQHALPYNWQIIDGYPIRIVRRPINDSLTIDHTITQDDCVVGSGPAVGVKRIDVSELPRELEIQYIDPDRQFANTTRTARHTGAPTTNPGTSIEIDFLISATQAREMAFDTLYRIWAQQLSLSFEHRDITIEPGDTVHITCDQGAYVALVQEATYTVARTTQVLATVLLASSGVTLPPGEYDLWPGTSPDYVATSPDQPASMSIRSTFAGVGNLFADITLSSGPQAYSGAATLAGSGHLSANAREILRPTAVFSGSGNLVANGTINQGPLASWKAAVIAAGGSVSSGRETIVGELINGLMADGIWSKLDRLWLFAAENTQSALIDIVSRTTATLQATNPTFDVDRGFTGNGSGWINCNSNPGGGGTWKFLLNDAHWSHWNLTTPLPTTNQQISGSNQTHNGWQIYSTAHYQRVNDSGGDTVTLPGDVGWFLASRYGASSKNRYYNGVVFDTVGATSSVVPNDDMRVLNANTGGGGVPSTVQVAAYSFGGNLDGGTDAAKFYERLRTYMSAVGIATQIQQRAALSGTGNLSGNGTIS